MATKIILTVDEELTAQEVDDLRYLLSDAIGEFAAHREPVDVYVSKRHGQFDMTEKAFEKKKDQVQRRVLLARKLHNAALGHTVEQVPKAVASRTWACGHLRGAYVCHRCGKDG